MNVQNPDDLNPPLELQLWNASLMRCRGDIRKLLKANQGINVNWGNPGSYLNTPLHLCSSDEDPEIIAMLLAHPSVEVNKKNAGGWTPLLWACKDGRLEAVIILLKDPRVNVNATNHEGSSSLWLAAFRGWADIARWLVVLRTEELDLTLRTNETHMAFPYTTAQEICSREDGKQFWDNDRTWQLRTQGRREVFSLLDRFSRDRKLAAYEARLELGLRDAETVLVFGLMVLLSDGYLEARAPSPEPPSFTAIPGRQQAARRMFGIAKQLPIELQMLLSHRVYSSMKTVILAGDSEMAFKHLFRIYHEEEEARQQEEKRKKAGHCVIS